jgi:hypothetical protein
MASEGGASSPRTKVERLLSAYDLGASYGADLEAAWTGTDGERRSLRDLAVEFNRRLLATAMEEAGMSTIDGEVDNLFRVLTTDEVTAGTRSEARSRLERNGVDVDQLERDFVSYQAIRSYLRDVREADYEEPDVADRLERTAESVGRLRSRLTSVTESNLEQLRANDEVTLGEFQLFTSVDVLCEECGSQYGVAELLERGGCDCADGPDAATD